jgi:type I restriction enzyme, S subunit
MKNTLVSNCVGIFDCEHKTAPLELQGYPSIRTPNIGKGRLLLDNVNYVSEITWKAWTKRAVPEEGDLIIAREAPAGNVAIIPANIELCLGQRTVLLKLNKEKVDPAFICYYLLSPKMQHELLSKSAGSTVPHVNVKDIKDLNLFNLPQLPIQKRLASILSAYDDIIENNLKRIKLLEEIAQRFYEEWFVKFKVNGEQLSIDETTGLPVGWKFESFNKIVEIISGFPFKSGDYVEDGKFKIVTIKNVQDGYFIPETTDSLLEIPTKLKAEQVLNTSDIIVSLTGNVGRICLVYGDNYLLNQRVAKVVPLDEYSKAYVYFLLRSKAMITSLENLSNGAAQQNLSPINMGNMKVNIPDKKLIMKFGELANNIIDLISTLNLENQKLKESRDILLPRLMSGTINVES